MSAWKNALELDINRNIISGSVETLKDAINNGADLRIYTEFRHNEHIDITSDNNELIKEVSDFPATYLIKEEWVAGIMTLRQPVTLPDRFGRRASMSFFMYNQDGRQSLARPFLDGKGVMSLSDLEDVGCDKSKYHFISAFDNDTIAPSRNFIYDFYRYKFLVKDDWQEVFSCDQDGSLLYGDPRHIEVASQSGCEIKVGISNICEGLCKTESLLPHQLFIKTGPHYFYTESNFMVAETRPFVRVNPHIPMEYSHANWDFGWAIVRTDGHVAGLYYNPYTLKDKRTFSRHRIRWFVR